MLLTKTLLTEVLLEVTNEEIYQVAKETHRKATKGLPPFFWVPCSLTVPCGLNCSRDAPLASPGVQPQRQPPCLSLLSSDSPEKTHWDTYCMCDWCQCQCDWQSLYGVHLCVKRKDRKGEKKQWELQWLMNDAPLSVHFCAKIPGRWG